MFISKIINKINSPIGIIFSLFYLILLVHSILFIGFSSNLISRYGRIIEVARSQFPQFNLINYRGLNLQVYAAEDEFTIVSRKPQAVLGDELNLEPTFSLRGFNKSRQFMLAKNVILKRQAVIPTPTPVPVFEDRSTNIRLNVEWPRAIRAFAKNPFLGTGYSSITLATDNDYLRLLGEVGALGFLAFFLIFGKISEVLAKVLPFDRHFEGIELAFIVGTVGAMLGIFLNAMFIDVFEASKFAIIFWLLIGFTISLTKYAKNE